MYNYKENNSFKVPDTLNSQFRTSIPSCFVLFERLVHLNVEKSFCFVRSIIGSVVMAVVLLQCVAEVVFKGIKKEKYV